MAALLGLVAVAPAAADSATAAMTITGWQAIGTGAIIVNALSQEGVWLLDADATPTAETGAVLIPYGSISPTLTAKNTQYARPANSKTTTTIGVVAAPEVSVGATPTAIVAARTGPAGIGRVEVTIRNTGTSTVYIGGASVATTTGFPLDPGDAFTTRAPGAICGLGAAAGQTVGYWETY